MSVSLSLSTRHSTLDTRFSIDQPICPGEHLRRNRQADLLGRLDIDYELELRRLLYRQVGGLGSLQDSVDVVSGAPKLISIVGCIGCQAAGLYHITCLVH